MIRALTRSYFGIREQYSNPVERQRVTALLVLDLALAIIWIVVGVTILIPLFFSASGDNSTVIISGGILPLIVIVGLYWLLRRGNLSVASQFVVFAIGAITLPPIVLAPSDPITAIYPLGTTLVAAGVLLERRGIFITMLIILALLFFGPIRLSQSFNEPITSTEITTGLILTVVNVIFATALLLAFSGRTSQIVREILLDNERLLGISDLNTVISETTDEHEIYNLLVEIVRRRFGYTLVQVYRLNEQGVLTNEPRGAQAQLSFGSYTTIPLQSDNALSRAAREAKVVRVGRTSSPTERSHMLPNSRYGLAIPLIHQRRILGVLDIQTPGDRDFSDTNISGLRLLAEEAATNVDYVAKLTLTQRTLLEQQGANARLREQLAELRRQGEVVAGSTWDSYLQNSGKSAIGYDFSLDDTSPIAASEMTPSLRAAFDQREVTVELRGNEQIITVPIVLRGAVMGAMTFSLPADRPVTPRQKELAQGVTARLTSALENKRLFEQVEAQANRERRANEVGALLLGATDVNTVLQLAASSFNEALGAINTQIYLQPGVLTSASATPPIGGTRVVESESKKGSSED